MNTDKKPRGRPRKKDSTPLIDTNISLLETNNNDLIIITDDSLTQTENLEIKPRGRPKKYSDEERKEKYKESSKIWKRNNYKEHSKELSEQSNKYQKQLRESYSILKELWLNKGTLVEFKSDIYTEKIKNLIESM